MSDATWNGRHGEGRGDRARPNRASGRSPDGMPNRMSDRAPEEPPDEGDPLAEFDRIPKDELVDALIQLMGWYYMTQPDSPYYTDERLIAWLERDLNSPERQSDSWPDWTIAEVAERIHARVMAAKLRVTVRPERPMQSRGAVSGMIPQVLDDAAAAGAAPHLDLAAAAGAGRDLWDEPCEEWVDLPAELPAGKYVALRVAGDSMSPLLHAGDTVLVNVKVKEGERSRVQAYEGVCIARAGSGLNQNFTVRKISYGEGVERVFPLYAPMIDSIKVVRRGKVRRAKLYYLRGLRGKKARIAEAQGPADEAAAAQK